MDNLQPAERGLFYLFERPYDPVYFPRASNGIMFNISSDLLPEGVITTRVRPGGTTINVEKPTSTTIPRAALVVPRGRIFSMFFRSHRAAAKALTDVFMGQNGAQALLDYTISCRDSVNETLFVYCLSYTLLRKPELRQVRLPAIFEVFPTRFIPSTTLSEAQNQVNQSRFVQSETREPVEHDMDFSGSDQNPEHRVAYWREDYGINAHHWHWHIVYPVDMNVTRDRKGELFYYMHQQVLARYDNERLSNRLNRVQPLADFRSPIPDGYFSKLTINNSNSAWGTRQDNSTLSNYNRTSDGFEPFTIESLEQSYKRIVDSIDKGFVTDRRGNRIPLTDDVDIRQGSKRGTDILGDAIEADLNISPNGDFYGDFHNNGHVVISAAHDPDGDHRENIGVMGDSATAMRDPVFYRLHKVVDNIFQRYKQRQNPYPLTDLVVYNINIQKLGISTGSEGNIIRTFFDVKRIEASRGLDFNSDTPVLVNLTRLNHLPFEFHILAENGTGADKRVTVRLFMASKTNQTGRRMSFMDQRLLWMEMDRFAYTLSPGSNHIRRKSTDSDLTIPDEQTFRDLESGDAATQVPEAFCGCGWPQHMFVSRGRSDGMTFELFCLLTDYELDKVAENPRGESCGNAAIFCGILDQLYPDRRPMGFPFDRRAAPGINTMNDFVKMIPNSSIVDINVVFNPGRT